MGQYYYVINVDKQQYLLPFDYNNGLKLMEWSYNRNDVVLAMTNLIATEWYGDRVYVVGDYAYDQTEGEVWGATLDNVLRELHTDDLFEYASVHFTRVLPRGSITDLGYRYLYNHNKQVYVDLKRCPVHPRYGASVSPLSLLLAMGNGRGGGDYRTEDTLELVGSWCSSSQYIEIRKHILPIPYYREFIPNFTE